MSQSPTPTPQLNGDAAAHTPGPWTVVFNDIIGPRPLGDSGIRCAEVLPSSGEYRGSVCNVSDALCIEGITLEERNANAHLIAAAPDLLAACEDALATFTGDRIGGAIASEIKLRAAIAKATGGAA